MAKTAKQLVNDAEHILSLVYQEDTHTIGSLDNVVSKENVHLVQQFEKDSDAITLRFRRNSIAYERIDVNRRFLNGRCIAVGRIQNIIDILKEL